MHTRRTIAAAAVAGLAVNIAVAASGSLAAATTVPDAEASPEAVAACANEISEIAVVSPYYSSQPATKEVVDAFRIGAEAAGYTVSVLDTRGDLAAVNSEIENVVAQGADAVALGMGDPLEFGAGLAATSAAAIPVFGLDAGAVPGITANITSDNQFLGELSAQTLIDAMGGEGRIVMIHFDPFEPVRLRGEAASALFEAEGIEVLEYIQGDPSDSTGFAKTTVLDLLSKYPEGEIDGIWVAWDASALGAFQATQEAGRTELPVTSVDGQDFARAEIAKDTNWIATVSQDWAGIAELAVATVDACSAGEAPTSQILTVPGSLVTADNALGDPADAAADETTPETTG